jgi:Restriction endonuclease BamHI
MKILQIEYLIREGDFGYSAKLDKILNEIKTAIYSIHWPENSTTFTLYPQKKGNGVVPIKKSFLNYLSRHEWLLEHRMTIASRQRPGAVDAVKELPDGRSFAVEWETGNISSSHRALNKMAVGLLDGILAGGILALPSRDMYQYLTDRVGNYAEIEPYFPVWRNLKIKEGVLAVIEIEHDSLSLDVPSIRKGTDGRALR